MFLEIFYNARLASSFINLKQIIIILISSLAVIGVYKVVYFKYIVSIKNKKSNILGYFTFLLGGIVLYLGTLAFLNPLMKKKQGTLQAASLTYVNFPKNIFSCLVYELEEYFSLKKIYMHPLYKERITYYLNQSNANNYRLTTENIPQTIVFVFGESLNASHLNPNGYFRETMPLLSKRDNIVFFKKPISCATITSKAHPCISKAISTEDMNFSNKIFYRYLMDSKSIKSFIHILSHLGFESSYITVGNSGNSIKIIENEAKNKIYVSIDNNKTNKEISFVEKNYKKAMQDVLASNNPKKLIVIYLEGSHYLYDNNCDNKHITFTPVLKSAILSNASNLTERQHVINAYDNTIVYTDYIMDFTISELEKNKHNAALFFFSDHGEQLIDPNMSPHGMTYKLAKEKYNDVIQPGAFVWFSNPWLQNINKAALKNSSIYKEAVFSYEMIFHSVLDCVGVQSDYVKQNKSICRAVN